MTTLAFLLGFLCGVATLMVIALYFSHRAKPKTDATPTCHAIGLGGNDPLEPYAARQLREIFTKYEGTA